jgi:hypothetical protein
MADQIVAPLDLTSVPFRTALAPALRQVRWWIAWRRRHESLADLSDWILRDMGVIRERDLGTSLQADPREAVRQFWRH